MAIGLGLIPIRRDADTSRRVGIKFIFGAPPPPTRLLVLPWVWMKSFRGFDWQLVARRPSGSRLFPSRDC